MYLPVVTGGTVTSNSIQWKFHVFDEAGVGPKSQSDVEREKK